MAPLVVQVPLVNANIATIAIESFLYGTFFVLAVLSIFLLVSHHAQQERLDAPSMPTMLPRTSRSSYSGLLKKPMFLAAIALSVTCTAHWIMTVIRAFLAFIQFNNGTTPLDFYADLHQLTEVVKTGFLMASLWIGDAAIIYRLWMIYGRSTGIIIFPICTLVGLGICGIGITYQFTQFVIGEDVFASAAGRWITSDCVFTLATNVYSTVAIAIRVWQTNRRAQSYGGVSLMPVLVTLVESAAIYTVWTLFFFVSYQTGSNLQFTAVDTWPQMSGIAFMMINVRVGLGWASSGRASSSTSHGNFAHGTLSTRGVAVNVGGVGVGGGRGAQWVDHGSEANLGGKVGGGGVRMEMGPVGGEYVPAKGRPVEVNITQTTDTYGVSYSDDSKTAPFGHPYAA